MQAILRRLVLLVKVWLNAVLAPAQDPREVFEVAHKRQLELLGKVRRAQARIAASRQQLQGKSLYARDKLPELEKQARDALLSGREDQARFALRLRQVAVGELGHLEEQVQELEREEGVLSLVEQRLATRIEAFFARQQVLAARYDTAEAQVSINEALSGVSEELADLGLSLERAENRTEEMQSRVTAIDQLVEMGVLQDPTRHPGDASLTQLTANEASRDVDAQLDALRRELQQG